MVQGIPTADDFYESGRDLLDFAWDVVMDLITEHDEALVQGLDLDEDSEKYWLSARRNLTTALAIVQQGVELVLKGKIASVSPFLLFADSPQKWPSPYKGPETKYADFRTIDAQDLIRAHDTFEALPLPAEFVARYHDLRQKRNALFHTVKNNLAVHAADVIESLLYMHRVLLPGESWASVRLAHVRITPFSVFSGEDYSIDRVSWELKLVFDMLKPAEVSTYFGVNKRQRMYLCPQCHADSNRDWDYIYKLAVLDPKGAASETLYCPICDLKHGVLRKKCTSTRCNGNVLGEDEVCLTCGIAPAIPGGTTRRIVGSE